ncbi:oxygenase MpaB family protein [Mycobacterium ulcerans]
MKRPATRVADLLNPAALLLPAANVIMQLSLPGVGYGVLESPVDSGNVYKHPFKRARTTGTYLAVATIGSESDRALIRAAVDSVHRQVRSTSSSPVSYNAFDPKLQLWVAACLYRYFVEQHEFLHGPLDDGAADSVYLDAKRLGTTLQVPERMWPPDRIAFDEYWKRSLDELHIDPPVREHLRGVASMAFLPWPLRALAGPFNLFATTGFLAPEFRAMMRLDWSQSQQSRFEWLLAALRLADRLIPHRAWILIYQLYLWDMRFRARLISAHQVMRAAKERHRAIPAKLLTEANHTVPPALLTRAARVISMTTGSGWIRPPFNVTISNIPGSPDPLYCAGARVVSQHPVNVLLDGMGLSITLLSYQDRLDFGLTADRELLPDVWHLADELAAELSALAAEVGAPRNPVADGAPTSTTGRPTAKPGAIPR